MNSRLEVTQGIRNYAETGMTNQSPPAPCSPHGWDLPSGATGQLQLSHRWVMGQLGAELCWHFSQVPSWQPSMLGFRLTPVLHRETFLTHSTKIYSPRARPCLSPFPLLFPSFMVMLLKSSSDSLAEHGSTLHIVPCAKQAFCYRLKHTRASLGTHFAMLEGVLLL